MIRLLLAFLALLTGLAAPVTSAQARLAVGEAEVGAVECNRGGARSVASQAASGDPAQVRTDRRKREAQRKPQPRSRTVIPTVQLGPDRARE